MIGDAVFEEKADKPKKVGRPAEASLPTILTP
jgi:hypothetical protein